MWHHHRRFLYLKLAALLREDVALTQHREKRIELNELHIRHGIVRIATLCPGHELSVTPHHGRVVTPQVVRADDHGSIWIIDVHNAVIAGMFCEEAFLLRIYSR